MNRLRGFVAQSLTLALLATTLPLVPVAAQQPAPPKVVYPLGLKEFTVASTQALPVGKATVRFEFVYDGGGGGKGGKATISVNAQEVATGRIDGQRFFRRRGRGCRFR